MEMTLLQAEAISVRRGNALVLSEVNLSLARGELLMVLGPNGAGKSTLARVLLGLEPPSSGSIIRAPQISVGYVPQAVRRDPTLPLSTQGFLDLAGSRAATDSARLVAALGVEPLLDRPLASLSGGELRRAALARALMRRPDLLVLDEPLAGIDAASQTPICELIAEHGRTTGAGIVLIAHEILTAARLAQRILCLDIKPQALGAPADVLKSPAFARLFGPAMAAAASSQLALDRQSSIPDMAAHG